MRTALAAAPEKRGPKPLRPVDVYLDVDGVVIPVFDPEVGVDVKRSGWNDWREPRYERKRYRVPGLTMYSPVMVNRLRRLADMEHVTMHWATTWRERADTLLAPTIGLPSGWEVIDRDMRFDREESENRVYSSWWKRSAIQAHHEQRADHAVVWIDDDLGFDEKARLWMRALGHGTRSFGVSPDTMVGLTSQEFRRIEQFVLHVR